MMVDCRTDAGAPPCLDEIARSSQNLRETYKLLKRISVAHLQSSESSYRRRFVGICLEKSSISTEDEIVVGFLLLSSLGLASVSVWQADDMELVERLCDCVDGANLGTTGVWAARDGVYALTLVKHLNTVALGLLSSMSTRGRDALDDDIPHIERVVLMVVACMEEVGQAAGGEVWVRVAKVVTAMAPHGRAVGRWIDTLTRILEGFDSIEGFRGSDKRRGNTLLADVAEEGVSCVRRMMSRVSSSSSACEGSCPCVISEDISIRLLARVAWLYGLDSSRDGHAGLAAMGAVGKAMSGWGSSMSSHRVSRAFDTAMEHLQALQNVDLKEMVWLAGVLYTTGRGSCELSWLLKWSVRCSLTALQLAVDCNDEAMATRCCSDVVQCIMVSRSGVLERETFCSLLVEVINGFRTCGRARDVSSLVARVIKWVYRDEAERIEVGGGGPGEDSQVVAAHSILDVAHRSVKDAELLLDLSKDVISALASAMRETQQGDAQVDHAMDASDGTRWVVAPDISPGVGDQIRLDAMRVVEFVHEAFNPGKRPDLYVEALVGCHAHAEAFPDLLSVDAMSRSLDIVSDKTNTKIGKKRIEDVEAVLEMLRVEAAISCLLKSSREHGELVVLKRKEALRKDPTLIHSDEWMASDSMHEIVSFMVKRGSQWQAAVNDAQAALSRAEQAAHAMDTNAARKIKRDLSIFVRLHAVKDAECSPFWSVLLSLDEGAAPVGCQSVSASMRQARSGNFHDAIASAIKGQRLAESTRLGSREAKGFSGESGGQGEVGTSHGQLQVAENGWWCDLESHIIQSAWLGFLFSVCGLYSESRQAYSDGLRTSCQVGAAPIAAYFSAVLAELQLVGDQRARFSAHANDAAMIVASGEITEATNSGDCAVGLLAAHVDILRAAMDRHRLEFSQAQSRLCQAAKAPAKTSWYGARIAALAAWQQTLLEHDQETGVSTERLERRLADVSLYDYTPVLLGAPYAMASVLLAQALSVPFFDNQRRTTGPDGQGHFMLWAAARGRIDAATCENHNEDCIESSDSPGSNARLALKLGHLAAKLPGSPFCLRTVLQLLAPVVATLGHKYATVVLLHASSNPTLEFQQRLVACVKKPKGSTDTGSPSPTLDPSECVALLNLLNHDIGSLEARSREIVTGWTMKVPHAVICGIAVYNAATFGPMRPRRDRIVLHRLRNGEVPVIIEVPSPEVEPAHPIHGLNGTRACGAIQFLGDRLQEVLKRSNANMRGVSASSSETEKRDWWQERINLDHSMQQLLQELQTDWIGPWRCLFMSGGALDAADRAPVDGFEEERELLKRLLASAKLSALELQSISGLLDNLDIDANALAEEMQDKLSINGTRGRPGTVNGSVHGSHTARKALRKVSFNSAADWSPDMCSVVRSEAGGMDESDVGAAIASVPETSPVSGAGSPPKTHVTVRRKHKSRLAHLQSLATPNPRRALGARNFAGTAYQTPVPKNFNAQQQKGRGDHVPMTAPVLSRHAQGRGGGRGQPSTIDETEAPAPILLVLDRAVQALPWESSFLMMNPVNEDEGACLEFYRVPSLPMALSRVHASSMTPAQRPASSAPKSIESTYYVVNPSGDLKSTQQTFESWFENLSGWSGVSGRAPTADVLGAALQEHDLFIYCGHGGGEQYLPASRLRALDSCASSVLMGCSSAKLADGSVYDASGVALSYLIAGSHAVVGNLWDVTDKDIDRYCTALLNAMLETPRGKANLGELVQQCRLNCRLMYLIGASPVVYGLPVHFN